MNSKSKIRLSSFELKLLRDKDWILTKHALIEKIVGLFGHLSEEYKKIVINFKDLLPAEVIKLAPKISKGERYRDLPYVMLDYPRFFSKNDVFAVRTFFWWGNYFSLHLQLKGRFMEIYSRPIEKAIEAGLLNGFYMDTSGDEWNYDMKNKFKRIEALENNDTSEWRKHPFLKVADFLFLEDWKEIENKFPGKFQLLLEIICSQLPRR